MEREIRLVIADDHEVVRRGIVSLVESRPGCKVVAEADTGEAAILAVKEHAPDIAILDFAMPNGRVDGLAATREIAREMPKVRVLILTMHASKQLVREILEAGARGYVMKSDAGNDLMKAIDTLLEDKLFFTQTISEILLDGFLEKPQPMRAENLLTKREQEIVSLLARGRSNKEVATELNISLRTAETHRANIMNKLQLHSVQDLVRYAVKNKMVEL
jgi:DNA-binding NarL/FixJ family response regulator